MPDENDKEYESEIDRQKGLDRVTSNETATSFSTKEKKSKESRRGGWRFPRRSALKKMAFTSAPALTGVTSLRRIVSGDHETLSDTNTESDGDHDSAAFTSAAGNDCAVTELCTSSALDADSTPYNKGGPVTVNWCAQVSKSHDATKIDNLEVRVEIDNPYSGWNFENAEWSKREAPTSTAFEPSFNVSVGLFLYSFGLSFSPKGTSNDTTFYEELVMHNFGEVCNYNTTENAGWLRVNLENPREEPVTTDVEMVVEVNCDVSYHGWGPGPCGAGFEETYESMSVFESYTVEIE